jgi:hypothetical protein
MLLTLVKAFHKGAAMYKRMVEEFHNISNEGRAGGGAGMPYRRG